MKLLLKVGGLFLFVIVFALTTQSIQDNPLSLSRDAPTSAQLQLVWQHIFEEPVADWVESQGILYILDRNGQLTALRSKDGETLWVINDITYKESSLSIVEDILTLVDWNSGSVVSINSTDGYILWRTRIAEFSHCENGIQVVGGKKAIFIGCDDKVYALDAMTGTPIWTRQLPNSYLDQTWIAASGYPSRSYTCIAYDQGTLYLRVKASSLIQSNSVQREGRILALDELTGEERWSFSFYYFPTPEIGSDSIATPFLFGDRYLFFITWNNVLFAIDRETGQGFVKRGRSGDTSPDRIPYSHHGIVVLGDNIRIWSLDDTMQLIEPWWINTTSYPKSRLSFVAPDWRHYQGVAIQPGDSPVLWRSTITTDLQEFVITSVDVLSGEQMAQYTLKIEGTFESKSDIYGYLTISDDMLVLAAGKKTLVAVRMPNANKGSRLSP